jgi:hypothetical protein
MFFAGRLYWANVVEFENLKSAMLNEVAEVLGFKSYRQCFSKRNRFVLRKSVLRRRLAKAVESVPFTLHWVKKWFKVDGVYHWAWVNDMKFDWSQVKELKLGRLGQK